MQTALQLPLFEPPPAPPIPDRVGGAAIGVRLGSKLLARPAGRAMDFDYTLNPYVGCGFGCAYCFAAAFVPDDQRREDWGKWVDVKLEAESQLRAKRDLEGKRIFMSSATDPYQPIEAKIGLTRRIVEILAERQPYLVVQTRSPLVARDIDLFRRFRQIRVNMSITTDSEEVRRRFEPSCPSIDRRIEALTEVSRAGIPTAVCIAPMLPVSDPEAFAKRLRAIGCDLYLANTFHKSDLQFASTTRDLGFQIAREANWGQAEYERTVAQMQKHLPQLEVWGRRFIASE